MFPSERFMSKDSLGTGQESVTKVSPKHLGGSLTPIIDTQLDDV